MLLASDIFIGHLSFLQVKGLVVMKFRNAFIHDMITLTFGNQYLSNWEKELMTKMAVEQFF